MVKHFGFKEQPNVIDIKVGGGKLTKRIRKDKMFKCGTLGGSAPPKHSLLSHTHDKRYEQKDPSCVTNSLSMAVIIVHSILYPNDPLPDPSVYGLYYWSRQTCGEQNRNTGTYIFAAIEAANDVGIPLEGSWPDSKSVFDKPDWHTYTTAKPNKPIDSERIYDFDYALIEKIKEVVGIRNRPIQFGMDVDQRFADWEHKNRSDVYDYVGPSLGGHAMDITGYDDDAQVIEVVNSHGRKFGYNGVLYVSYETIVRKAREATVISKVPRIR